MYACVCMCVRERERGEGPRRQKRWSTTTRRRELERSVDAADLGDNSGLVSVEQKLTGGRGLQRISSIDSHYEFAYQTVSSTVRRSKEAVNKASDSYH